jgi:ferrochelatase
MRQVAGYDAVIVVSFGGPEGPDDVIPFLERVLRGRNVPRERLLAVAGHYQHFGGKSPINDQNRALIEALRQELKAHGPDLPVYWGNRNWRPFLLDTLKQMHADGVGRALAFCTSAFGSYSGCRQYREDLERARAEFGPGAPELSKLRLFYDDPGFVEAMADRVRDTFQHSPDAERLIFTAHSVPGSMAANSPYVAQLRESCTLVAERLGRTDWELAYQSRSGPPGQPWLGPDINDRLRQLAGEGVRSCVVAPIGFLSDHMEVVYDLDTEARQTADSVGLRMFRAGTVGTHSAFVSCVRRMIAEECGRAETESAAARYERERQICHPECCAVIRPVPSVQAAR